VSVLEDVPIVGPELDYVFINESRFTISNGNPNRYEVWNEMPCIEEGKTIAIQVQVAIDPLLNTAMRNGGSTEDQLALVVKRNGTPSVSRSRFTFDGNYQNMSLFYKEKVEDVGGATYQIQIANFGMSEVQVDALEL